MLNYGGTWRAFLNKQNAQGPPKTYHIKLWVEVQGQTFACLFIMNIGLGTIEGQSTRIGPIPPGYLVLILHSFFDVFLTFGKDEILSHLQGSQDQTHNDLNE